MTIPFPRAGLLAGMRGIDRGEALDLIAYRDALHPQIEVPADFSHNLLLASEVARGRRALIHKGGNKMANPIQLWNAFRGMEHFGRDFDEVFDRVLGRRRRDDKQRVELEPAIESYVEGDKLVVRADLPGIDPKNVEISQSVSSSTVPIGSVNFRSVSQLALTDRSCAHAARYSPYSSVP